MADAPIQEQAPAPIEGQAPQQGGGSDAIESMKKIGLALDSIAQAMQDGGAPPEALQALSTASSAFNEFLTIITGGAPSRPDQVPAEQAGAQGVRPAGAPGPGAVPAQA